MSRDALVVGINRYPFLKDSQTGNYKHLSTPATDAEAIAHLLEKHGDFRVRRFPDINIDGKLQVDREKPVKVDELKAAILNLFLPESRKPPETALLFFAGHGLREELRQNLTQGFLATSDANPGKNSWGLSLEYLWKILQQSQVKQQVIWLDCCFAGELLNFNDTELGRNSSGCDRFLIAASRDYEVAYQQLDGQHGVLTGALLAGLNPLLVPEFEWITNLKLASAVQESIQAYNRNTNVPQSPLISNYGEPIKLIQGTAKLLINSQSLLQSDSSSMMDRDYLQEADNIFELPFFGRTEELKQLNQFLENRYPLITLVGMVGIGKTALAAEFTKQNKNQFQHVIWKNLRATASFEDFLNELLNFLSVNTQELTATSTDTDRVQILINYLTINQCLLIIDDLTEVLTETNRCITYKQGWENLGTFLKYAALKLHQSIILITCHEHPKNLNEEDIKNRIKTIKLKGLNVQDIQQMFPQLQPQNDPEYYWQRFLEYYGGNPGILNIVAKQISEEYDDDISNFIEYEHEHIYGSNSNRLEDKIKQILNKQFNRLESEAQELMYWLAIKNEPLTREKVRSLSPSYNSYINTLTSLSLIIHSPSGYTQLPMIMDYVTEKIIDQVVEDIATKNSQIINDYPLIDSQAKEYIKDIQKRRLIEPIIDKLLKSKNLHGKQTIKENLISLLDNWRKEKPVNRYMGGNILTLLLHLDIDINGSDFSEIPLGNLDLQGKQLHQINFTNSDLSNVTFSESLGCIDSVIFQADGKYFATAETNGNVRLWQTDTYKQVKLFSDNKSTSQIWSIAFSPDGKMIASAGEDKTVRLWDVEKGDKSKEIKDNQCIYSVSFSHNDRYLLSAGDERIAIWNVITGNLENEISIIGNQFHSIAINKRSILAIGCENGLVILYDIRDINSPQILQSFGVHNTTVRCITFSPDDTTIASGSEDGTIKLWKINSDDSFQTLTSEDIKQVWTISFSQDGKILASGSTDENPIGIDEHHNIRLWNLDNGTLQKLGTHNNQLRTVAFCPQAQQSNLLISGGDDHTIKIWDITTQKRQKIIQGYTNRIWSVAFSPCGKKLVSGCEDHRVRIWDVENKQCIQQLLKHTDWVWSVVFSPDGQMIASASEDNTIRLWHLRNEKWEHHTVLRKHTQTIRVVAFSPDSKKLVSGGNDYQVILWDLTKRRYQDSTQPTYPHKILGESKDQHNHRILSLAFSPDGKLVASSSRDKTIRLWNLETNEVPILGGHDNQVHAIAFSPDGDTLVSGGFDHKVKLWNIKKRECIRTLEGHEDRILCVAFHPEGSIFASSGHDKKIRLWSKTTKECIRSLEGHTGAIESISFSPQGGSLVSSSQDQTIRIWDIFTGECLEPALEPDSKPYKGMIISGATGLTPSQRHTLITLGAIDE
ncbi:caspase family protein [Nostoc sp. UHCC 0702]|nr:caspase family protein [Nostoc sp. UHCC 0702]